MAADNDASALYREILNEDSTIVIELLQFSRKEHITYVDKATGDTPLHVACRSKMKRSIFWFFDSNYLAGQWTNLIINSENKQGETPLILAIRRGIERDVLMMLQNGADANHPRAIVEAVERNNTEILSRVLCFASKKVGYAPILFRSSYKPGYRSSLETLLSHSSNIKQDVADIIHYIMSNNVLPSSIEFVMMDVVIRSRNISQNLVTEFKKYLTRKIAYHLFEKSMNESYPKLLSQTATAWNEHQAQQSDDDGTWQFDRQEEIDEDLLNQEVFDKELLEREIHALSRQMFAEKDKSGLKYQLLKETLQRKKYDLLKFAK